MTNPDGRRELLPRVARFCSYAQYVFPGGARRTFLGAYQDMVRSYLEGRAELSGKWAKRWMDCVLILHTFHIIILSFSAWLSELAGWRK